MALATDTSRKVLGRLDPKHFLNVYPHSSALCHNLHKNISQDKIVTCMDTKPHKDWPYEVTYPLPANKPFQINRSVINGMDPGMQLVNEKHYWEKQKTELLKYCLKNHVENIEDSDLESEDTLEIPFSIVLLSDHFSKDPDKYFNNNYNVYYTGGNISSMNVASEKYLITPKETTGDTLINMEHIPERDTTSALHSPINSSTEANGSIFQIEAVENHIISRQKKKICLFSIGENEDGTIQLKNKIKVENEVPYFSVALHQSKFCFTTADRKLSIFDINTAKCILNRIIDCEKGTHVSDSWCSAHFIDENILCFFERSYIGFIDLRVKTTLAEKWLISKVTEHCEEIYCGTTGSKGIQYVTTSHQLLSLDARAGFCERFTHGITHSPALMSVVPSNSSLDRIFIGSQISDSVVLMENNVSEGNCLCNFPPYLIPNLADSLHTARFNGSCLGNKIRSRFSMCMTGLHVIEDQQQMTLYKLTSIGDIFKQSLKKSRIRKDIEFSTNDLKVLDDWETECEQLCAEDGRTCTVAHIYEDKHLINHIKSTDEYIEPIEKIAYSEVPWGISKKELLSYCDYLAPRILEEWGLDELEEWAPEEASYKLSRELSSSDEEEDITEKVSKWIEKYNEEDDTVYYTPDTSIHDEEVIAIEPDKPENENLVISPNLLQGTLSSETAKSGF